MPDQKKILQLSSLDSLNQASFILISSIEESLKLQKGDRKNQIKKKKQTKSKEAKHLYGADFTSFTKVFIPHIPWVFLHADTY